VIDPTYSAQYAWKLWTIDWPNPTPGEHSITGRAIDQGGVMQAAPTDPIVARKKTYWESFGWVTRKVRISQGAVCPARGPAVVGVSTSIREDEPVWIGELPGHDYPLIVDRGETYRPRSDSSAGGEVVVGFYREANAPTMLANDPRRRYPSYDAASTWVRMPPASELRSELR
jgi:hypothetical protein